MLSIKENKILVQLSSSFDESRLYDFTESQYFHERCKPYGNCFFEVSDIAEAKNLCMMFIKHFNLSSSNWTGGRIVNGEMKFIARISYNGRIWDDEDWQMAEEIVLNKPQ